MIADLRPVDDSFSEVARPLQNKSSRIDFLFESLNERESNAMIYLTDTSLLQFNLIEIGVLLQLMAIGIYIRETSSDRPVTRSRRNEAFANEQGLECDISDEAAPAKPGRARDESFEENAHSEMKAGKLTRTAKVNFVQSFKFRT